MINKKSYGFVGAMITAFITLFALILLWNVFTPVMNTVVVETIQPMINNSDAQTTLDTIWMSWKYYPILIVFGIILFIFVRGITDEAYGR